MTLDQLDQLAIVKTNLALLAAIKIEDLDQSAQFGFDRMIHESFSIVDDIVSFIEATHQPRESMVTTEINL